MAKKLIMSWSKASVKIGESTGTKTMPTLSAMGVINDKSTKLEASDGDKLQAKASGGVVLASESSEGGYTLTTRVKEPPDELYETFGLGEINETSDDLEVVTHVVQGDWAVEVTPKNIGAIGIRAPYCRVTFKPGRSEEEGEYADVTFEILPILDDNYEVEHWYSKFRKPAPTT